MRSGGYKTKQRAVIENFLKDKSSHLTADELYFSLASSGINIGRTTVYRCLEKMADEGSVRKYAPADGKAACYQYVPENKKCHEHFHLKCEKCGELYHMECHLMDELYSHIEADHGFKIDRLKTVIYGVCEKCSQK